MTEILQDGFEQLYRDWLVDLGDDMATETESLSGARRARVERLILELRDRRKESLAL